MKVNLDDTMKSFDGSPVHKMGPEGPEGNLTLRDLFVDILLKNDQSEFGLHASEKLQRFEMARTIFHADEEYDLSVDEMATIKKCMVDKNFPVMVVGTITELFKKGD